jgi:hypothetical protein
MDKIHENLAYIFIFISVDLQEHGYIHHEKNPVFIFISMKVHGSADLYLGTVESGSCQNVYFFHWLRLSQTRR